MQSISPLFAVEAENLIDDGKIAEAIELCRRGLEEYPGYAAGTVALAKALSAAGEAEEAKREIEAARAESSGVKAFNAPLITESPRNVAPEHQYELQPDLSGEELTEEDFSSLNTQANEEILLDNFSEETEALPEGLEDNTQELEPELPSDDFVPQETEEINESEDEIPTEDEIETDAPVFVENEDEDIVEIVDSEYEIPTEDEIETDAPVFVEEVEGDVFEIEESEDEISAETSVSITEDIEFDNVDSVERVSEEIEIDAPASLQASISERFDLIPGLEFFRFESKFRRGDYPQGLHAEAFDFRAPGDLDALAAALNYATVPASATGREDLFDEEPTKPAPFMTETIANLYVLQGELEQACGAFLRLAEATDSPEKSIEYQKKAEELQFQLEMRKANQ